MFSSSRTALPMLGATYRMRKHFQTLPNMLPVERPRTSAASRLCALPKSHRQQQPRSPLEHSALVSSLQKEDRFRNLQPPAASVDWSERLLRSWFEAGGCITLSSLSNETACSAARSLIDCVGEHLPVRQLEWSAIGSTKSSDGGGLLGALRHDDTAAVSRLFDRLMERDIVACTLGADPPVLEQVVREAGRARPSMRAGEVRADDGTLVAGFSPSGQPRGDVFVLLRNLQDGSNPDAWPGLVAADEALGFVGSALAEHLANLEAPTIAKRGEGQRLEPAIALGKRSDSFVACFPGDGLGYGAHVRDGCLTSLREARTHTRTHTHTRAHAHARTPFLSLSLSHTHTHIDIVCHRNLLSLHLTIRPHHPAIRPHTPPSLTATRTADSRCSCTRRGRGTPSTAAPFACSTSGEAAGGKCRHSQMLS